MRLIDADELMQHCYQELEECTGEDFKEGIRWMMVDVVNLPTVDAVEVVRCKDCKHNSKNGGTCEHICINADDEWFCADGEKVTE